MNDLRFSRSLRKVFLVPLVTVLLGAFVLYWQIHGANRTVDLMQSSEVGVTRAAVTERLIVDQETGLRGYQTTGDPIFLSSFRDAERQLNPAMTQLRASIGQDGARLTLLDQLKTDHEAWEQGFAVPLIATIEAGGKTDDTELNLQGKRQMDAMRGLLARITQLGEDQRGVNVARWHTQVRRTTIGLIVLALIIGSLIGVYTTSLLRSISAAFRHSSRILRERADEAFRSEQRLRITLASIGEAVITCDAEGRVQTMNQVAIHLTGLSEESASGKPLHDIAAIISADTREPWNDPFLGKVRFGKPVAFGRGDGILLRQDGTEVLIDESGAVMRDQTGTVTGYVLVLRDVTVVRKSQEALLANEKLAVAGRLAASIAHEIHNPLDAVSNLLFLMDGVSSPEESAQFLELARGEIARVTQISRAMLSLHRESLAPVSVDLREMLSSVLLLLDRRFADLGVTAVPHLPPDVLIQGYPAELRQVFTNLLTNAAEASPRGAEIHLTVESIQSPVESGGQRSQPCVSVLIEDSGTGIPEKHRGRLFEPFVTTKGEGGSGLGLWISKGIVTKHGGEILLESSTAEADHGTAVTVLLPSVGAYSSRPA